MSYLNSKQYLDSILVCRIKLIYFYVKKTSQKSVPLF